MIDFFGQVVDAALLQTGASMVVELEDQTDDPGLTTREREVLQRVAQGMSAKQIAQDVGIAPRTVERHIENCRHKMRAKNKTHLIARAVATGELSFGISPMRLPS